MEQEMLSTPVDITPAFLQLRDKYIWIWWKIHDRPKQLIWQQNNTCYWPVMPQTFGNDLNSKAWVVNYDFGPKK